MGDLHEGGCLDLRNHRGLRWIDDHARWMQRPGNAASFGLPDDVIEELGKIPWDFNGSGRKSILMMAMEA